MAVLGCRLLVLVINNQVLKIVADSDVKNLTYRVVASVMRHIEYFHCYY